MSRIRIIGASECSEFDNDRKESFIDQREKFSTDLRASINYIGRAAQGFIDGENSQICYYDRRNNQRNRGTGLCRMDNRVIRGEIKRNLNKRRSDAQIRKDPFTHFCKHHDDFGMLLDSPWPSEPTIKPRLRVQDRLDFFSEFDGFFDNFQKNFINRKRRTTRVIDLIPPINLFLDNGIRKASNRRRDQGLLEMFFGQFGDINGLNFDPMHDFFNSRRSRGLDIAQILSHLSAIASGSNENDQSCEIDRLQTIKITSKILASTQSCTICQEDFKQNETIKKLPCDHYFHANCILPWLQSQSTCPICRAGL